MRPTTLQLIPLLLVPLLACNVNDDIKLGGTSTNTTQTSTNNTATSSSNTMATATEGVTSTSTSTSSSTQGMTNQTTTSTGTGNATATSTSTSTATATSTGTSTNPPVMLASCKDAKPPERCSATPSSFNQWSPASVVSSIGFFDDPDCCRDFNGDGADENAFADIISLVNGSIKTTNDEIQNKISSGAYATIIEHVGLEKDESSYSVSMLNATRLKEVSGPSGGGSNVYNVDPNSFEQGTFGKFQTPAASISSGDLNTSEVGKAFISFEFADVPVTLVITSVAYGAKMKTALLRDHGPSMREGLLTGVISALDLINQLNSFVATNCACIETNGAALKTPLFVVRSDKDTRALTASCAPNINTSSCPKSRTGGICQNIATAGCSIVGPVISQTDTSTSNVGSPCGKSPQPQCDGFSTSIELEAFSAQINATK